MLSQHRALILGFVVLVASCRFEDEPREIYLPEPYIAQLDAALDLEIVRDTHDPELDAGVLDMAVDAAPDVVDATPLEDVLPREDALTDAPALPDADTMEPDADEMEVGTDDVAPDVAPDVPSAPACDAPFEATFEDDGATDAEMIWTPIVDAAARNAVCNDGSEAGYYIRRGTGEGLDRWVIFLEGGTICATPEMCDGLWERVPRLMSSTLNPPTMNAGGILSTNPESNADFYHANHVYVPYCSMDYWTGDQPPSGITGGWHFRGAQILEAVVEDLIDDTRTPTPNLYRADSMVLIGSSAGGVGVMAHLDRLAQNLPCVSVHGLNDGGWGVKFEPYSANTLPPELAATYAQGVWNGQVDADCADSFGLDGVCFFADVAIPHISTPLFTYIDQRDAIQLGALGVRSPYDEDERAFITSYQEALRLSLAPLSGAFSPLSGPHTVVHRNSYTTLELSGITYQKAFTDWYFGREGTTRLVEE